MSIIKDNMDKQFLLEEQRNKLIQNMTWLNNILNKKSAEMNIDDYIKLYDLLIKVASDDKFYMKLTAPYN